MFVVENQNDSDDDEFDLSTDQTPFIPVVSSSNDRTIPTDYIDRFQSINSLDLTRTSDDQSQEKLDFIQGDFRLSYNRTHLLKSGYPILSNETFPFYSLCYLCGSIGNELIYCNCCCQAYHLGCLTSIERPQFVPTPDSWLCPNCRCCSICGLHRNLSSLLTCFDCKRLFHVECLTTNSNEKFTSQTIWLCPLCIKCDCGEKLISNSTNLLASSEQASMCAECLTNFKEIQTKKTSKIRKCHLCDRYIGQFLPKPKPLFPLTLIGHQTKSKTRKHLLQCQQCEKYFHPICDGYLNEDILLIEFILNDIKKLICSKCDQKYKDFIQNSLKNYKIQIVKTLVSSMISTLKILITTHETLLISTSNLEQLHLSRHQSLNLHSFITDLFILIQHLLIHLDARQWQAAIFHCIQTVCPWFQISTLYSSNQTTLLSSSTNNFSLSNQPIISHCQPYPSLDHTYSLAHDRLLSQSNRFLTSKDSLLCFLNQTNSNKHFDNFFALDTRICELCQTYADHLSTNISRLISTGFNQWTHIGCILPMYSKSIQQYPLIVKNLSMKYSCDICRQINACVQCFIKDCQAHFHVQCIDEYYQKLPKDFQDHCQIIHGLLPNLTTFCPKHSREKFHDYQTKSLHLPSIPSIHFSSPIYVDRSQSTFDFSRDNIKMSLGSLQIHSFGNFDYLLDSDPIVHPYPNQYHASRVFWSTTNAQEKTVYDLHVNIYQTYHENQSNHRTMPCHHRTSISIQTDQLFELYQQWLTSQYGRIEFTVRSHDGFEMCAEDLDRIWSTVVERVRDCRDNMNLTHLSLVNEHLTGHDIFGLTNSIIRNYFNQILVNETIVSFSNGLLKKKNRKKTSMKMNSRLNIYKRKSEQYQRFRWLLNPHRTLQVNAALAYSRQILLEEQTFDDLLLYHLSYFSDRVLVVGSSSIHGCGLFTLIDLAKEQMIIEYKGEVIRPCLTDKREEIYEKQNFGCYMFTVDSMNVIDATHQGNKARFINHHCQPNCFAKTIISNGVKHIIIYALKNISSGSELTYDYSFAEEDIKIPCHCGTSQCRMYLN